MTPMTWEEFASLEARSQDALVGTHVFGWAVKGEYYKKADDPEEYWLPHFTERVDSAWRIVEHYVEKGRPCTILSVPSMHAPLSGWDVILGSNAEWMPDLCAPFPLAIVLCGLKEAGVIV